MANLYTSLTRLKMSAGGVLPPMTTLTQAATELLDPAHTMGMGALIEDVTKGLQCPVRGCGRWFHDIGRHFTVAHSDIGGREAICDALEIPRATVLVSTAKREKQRERWNHLDYDEKRRRIAHLDSARERMLELLHAGVRKKQRVVGMRLAGRRNLKNRCEAQLAETFKNVASKVNRSPTMADVRRYAGEAVVWHVIDLYGSFNNAKRAFRLAGYGVGVSPSRKARASKEATLAGLKAYYSAHGCFPSSSTARNPNRSPVTPCMETIMRAMGALTWDVAMQRAAVELGILSEKYGYPRDPNVRLRRAIEIPA